MATLRLQFCPPNWYNSFMCGRYTLTKELHELAKRFEAEMTDFDSDCRARRPEVSRAVPAQRNDSAAAGNLNDRHARPTIPQHNIAPTQSVIVVNDTGQRQIVTM